MSRRQLRHLDTGLLKSKRAEHDLSQEGLARELGVTLRTVQRWEDGSSDPGGAQVLRLADVLKVSAEDLYVAHTEAAA